MTKSKYSNEAWSCWGNDIQQWSTCAVSISLFNDCIKQGLCGLVCQHRTLSTVKQPNKSDSVGGTRTLQGPRAPPGQFVSSFPRHHTSHFLHLIEWIITSHWLSRPLAKPRPGHRGAGGHGRPSALDQVHWAAGCSHHRDLTRGIEGWAMFPPSRLSQCYMEPMRVGKRDDPPWARPACFCSARSMPLKPYCTCHTWPWPACCPRGVLIAVSSLQTPDLMDLVFKNVTVFIHPISVFLFAKNENIHHMLFYKIIFNVMIYCERLFIPKNSEL